MNKLSARKQPNMPVSNTQAVAVAGQLEPIDPAYYKTLTPSPISSQLNIAAQATTRQGMVVCRAERKAGMRYMYVRGQVRQPISPLGTGPDLGNAVWSSDFQPDFQGPIHDAGFNDALFEAGYPGYNLALSFKVAKLPTQITGPGHSMRMRSSNVRTHIQKYTSSKGRLQPNG